MDLSTLAGYAYHNCEFQRAVDLLLASAPDATAAEIHVKCLAELDQKDLGLKWALTYAADFPSSGALSYLVGMAAYLAGRPAAEVEAAFVKARALAYPGAALGLAFIAFAGRRFDDAAHLLAEGRGLAPEMEHVRRLMLFQVRAAAGDLEAAERELTQADRLLKDTPSLLRQLWGQLCWVRLLRAKGTFEGARAVLERILAQVSPATTPRLHRNALEALRMIEQRSGAANITLPPASATPKGLPAAIRRKPMLSSLYAFLASVGPKGASKEALAAAVWDERYNPVVHDDRIYKAVARLRKLIGDDQDQPTLLVQLGRQYILTALSEPEPKGVAL